MSATSDSVLTTSDKRQFIIRACLGRGGFGEVYRASMTNATGLESDVALKVLHNDLDIDSQAVQRLRDEGRMLGALVHPAIVRVYDLVILDGRVGLVTEYVEGADLSDCIRGENPMHPRAVAAVIGRVADALHAAWVTPTPGSERQLNLIHRDVKPANIRIGVEGAIKLLDFGVAHSSRVNREAHTNTGHMVGSYLYMAPECLTENTFSRASDVFALGATMYEALAAERLFPDQSLRELYVLVLKDDAYDAYIDDRLSRLEIPDGLLVLLRRMLAQSPADRPTAKQVSELCEDLVDTLPGPTLRRWCKARDWPRIQAIPGMLDGRTITEATMAATLRPDFVSKPPRKRRSINWGTVVAGFGGMSLALSTALVVLTLGIVLYGWVTRDNSIRFIERPRAQRIAEVDTRGMLQPKRTEVRTAAPVPEPRTGPTSALLEFKMASGKARLSRGGRHYYDGSYVPHGTYDIWINIDKGFERKQSIEVSGSKVRIECNVFKRVCTVL